MMSEEQNVAGVLAVLDRAIAEAEHKPGEWSAEPGTICAPWARFSYARDGQLAMAAVNSLPVLMATVRCQAAELERIRAMEEDRPTDAMLDDMRRHGLSIDGDNAYKRDLIDCIVGYLSLGKIGASPPLPGHWGEQFWEMGRAEAELQARLVDPALAVLDKALRWINSNIQRLHAVDCSVHAPSAACSCGLHRALTYLHAIRNGNAHLFVVAPPDSMAASTRP